MEARALLLALQLGDSFFPSGAAAYSFGLEGLWTDGFAPDARAVERFLEAQLAERWARADRVALHAAYAARGDLEGVLAVDEFADSSTLVESWRIAGRRLGRALLITNAALRTPLTEGYLRRVKVGAAPAQASAVQGLIAFGTGLSAPMGEALSAYTFSAAIVSAALRLGTIGHLEAQRLLRGQLEHIVRLVAEPVAPLESFSSWVPGAEIAAMRHEARTARLFTT
jgi:urease accessory protein